MNEFKILNPYIKHQGQRKVFNGAVSVVEGADVCTAAVLVLPWKVHRSEEPLDLLIAQ